jgi:hypothetical protein
MRHGFISCSQPGPAARRRGWADWAVRVPRDRWVSRSATSTVTIRNDGFTSKPAKLKSWSYATSPMDQSQAAALHRAMLQA